MMKGGIAGSIFSEKLGPVSRKVLAAGVGAYFLSNLFQLGLNASPDEAQDTAFDKIRTGLVIGAAGLMGKRSKEGGLLENFPTAADAFLTVPRAGLINLTQMIAEDEDVAQFVNDVNANPGSLSDAEAEQFNEIIKKGDAEGLKGMAGARLRPVFDDEDS